MKLKILIMLLAAFILTACITPKLNENNSTENVEQVQNAMVIMEMGYCILNPNSMLCNVFDKNQTSSMAKALPPVKFSVENVEDINLTHKKILIKILGDNIE